MSNEKILKVMAEVTATMNAEAIIFTVRLRCLKPIG